MKNMHTRIKSFYPLSTASAYIVEADKDTRACAEVERLTASANAHPASVIRARQGCFDSKVHALDRALLQTCALDWVMQDSASTVVHVRIGDSFCGRPPPLDGLIALLREHHEPGKPCHLIYSAHESCGELTTRYFTSLIRAQWKLNTTRYSASSGSARSTWASNPVIEPGDATWSDVDRHLCAMANAKVFVQGSGGFSYLAERVRSLRGRFTLKSLVGQESKQTAWLEAERESSGQILAMVERDAARAREDERLRETLRAKLAASSGPSSGGFTKPAVWKRWATRESEVAARTHVEMGGNWAKALMEGPGQHLRGWNTGG